MPLTEASTAPVPLINATPLALLMSKPAKLLAPSPVICCAMAPLKLTVPDVPLKVPVDVKAAPTTLKPWAALTVFPLLIVKLPNVLVPAPDIACTLSGPVAKNVESAAACVNVPAFE